ncbi:MAG: bifunctional oligoribonuclease/PAP phosphatase NrnA [Fidelibacterota bacterium]|nr:MAG: bifunctional oligoribonuclease/PAP phosphatase NrnA [Candidatus Neomarinimicrobiota bacterium]
MDTAWKRFDEVVRSSRRILLSTHENPDGDGIGSQLAFCEHLKDLGKECRILNGTNIPAIYGFLDPEGWIEVYRRKDDEEWLAGCELAIVFDLGDFRRLREVGEDLLRHSIALASIDHHPQSGFEVVGGTLPYAHLMLDYSAPSTGTLVWEYFSKYRQAPITRTMAEALYTALITDTGSFRYDNTNERAHHMAIDMLRAGIKPYLVHRRVYEERERAQVRLLGAITASLQYSDDGRISWCALTQEMLKNAGATRKDVDGFSDFLRTIKGVEVAVLLTEVDTSQTKVSFRSKGNLAINDVANIMGGGGHPFASGALVKEPWQQVIARILPLLEEKLAALDTNEEGISDGS